MANNEHHVCGAECPDKDLTTITYCWSCNDVCYLSCYNILLRKSTNQFEKHSPVQLICNKCRSTEAASRKRKISNTDSEPNDHRDSKVQKTSSQKSTSTISSITSSDIEAIKNIAHLVAGFEEKLTKISENTDLIKTINLNVNKLSSELSTVGKDIPSTIASSIQSVQSDLLSQTPSRTQQQKPLEKKQNQQSARKSSKTPINQGNPSTSHSNQIATPKTSRKTINQAPKASDCTSTINFDFTTIAPTITPVAPPPTNSFERMIWLGGVPAKTSTTDLKLFIERQFDMDSTDKITLKPLIAKDKNIDDFKFVSYKINVDCLDTLEQLLDTSKWPKGCRIREFINRPKKVTFGDFLPKAPSPKSETTSSALIRQSPNHRSSPPTTTIVSTTTSSSLTTSAVAAPIQMET